MEKLVRESGRTGRKEGRINNKDYLKKRRCSTKDEKIGKSGGNTVEWGR